MRGCRLPALLPFPSRVTRAGSVPEPPAPHGGLSIHLPGECLALPPLARAGPSAIHTDPTEFQIVTGTWSAAVPGREVPCPEGGGAPPAGGSGKGS